MIAGIVQGLDQEWPFEHAEIRHHELKIPDALSEKRLLDQRIGGGVLEYARAADARRFHARAGDQLTPRRRAFAGGAVHGARV